MSARKSTIFLSYLAVAMGVFFLVFVHAALERIENSATSREKAAMVERYGLSDLCIFTDARYSRNPAVADLGTPFQDHPLSLEHFPSGSIMAPPAVIRRDSGQKRAGFSWIRGERPLRRAKESRAN
jgi:hypothetical protein